MPTNLADFSEEISMCNEDDWTRDLPVCHLSRMGTLTNQLYLSNGYKSDEHPFYEIGFNYLQDDIGLYAVFSGSRSARCAKYAALTFPAELLLGQLDKNQTPELVISTLQEAWTSVDKQYLGTIDDLVLESVRLTYATENLDSQLQSLADPSRLAQVTREIHAIASGILCVTVGNNLILSYAGECVAVLAHQKEGAKDSDPWDASVLTCGHNRENEDEKLRIGQQALIDLELANVRQTRFLGHQSLKSVPSLRIQPEELVLQMQPTWKFLILASPGVFEVLSHLNPDCEDISVLAECLCRQIREEFAKCAADDQYGNVLNRVPQNVVEELGKMHFRAFSDKQMTQNRRPDMTIMIKVFDESILEHRPSSRIPSRASSTMNSTLSNTMSSIYNSRDFVEYSNAPIPTYVDFSSFVERAKNDPTVPSWWLESSVPTADKENLTE